MDFELAYEEHLGRVYAFLVYRLASRADAEDLTQQTFERALRSWARFDPARGSLANWLLSIARNLLIDRYRADAAARSGVSLDEVSPAALPTQAAPRDPGLEPELAGALSALPPRDQEILALRYGGDLTGPEIASMTGLSLANVQQIISRSLRELRRVLGDEGAGGPRFSVPGGRHLPASPAPDRLD
jgi:RNA polymerase sigma factor (sigma-70 family)